MAPGGDIYLLNRIDTIVVVYGFVVSGITSCRHHHCSDACSDACAYGIVLHAVISCGHAVHVSVLTKRDDLREMMKVQSGGHRIVSVMIG